MEGFCERLKGLRKAHGMTQEDLGNKVGVSRATVASWEIGRYMPETPKLADIARTFDVTLDFLMGLRTRSGLSAEEAARLEKLASLPRDLMDGYDELPEEAKRIVQSHYRWVVNEYGKDKQGGKK